MKRIAMIGVGKLGQDCAEVMAEHYDVIGYDVEPRTPSNFNMASTIQEAVSGRDLIFIAAPTPHDPIYGGETPTSHLPKKDFDYTIVTNILREVNNFVNKNQLVVLISTVLPGTVRGQLEPCITNARFIYNPYLIAMGTVKWDMVNPEMVIIGTDDGSLTGDAQELIDFYKPMMKNDPRYEVGTWDEAEAIKIFYNTFISTKLALVNMIQDVAEANGNMNVDVVTNALAKSTHRIMGPAYMKAGLGDAGACHPRDNIALRYMAEKLDLGYDLFDSIMTAREIQAEKLAKKCLQNGKNVTIIGKAYKPKVHYINGSASLLVGHYIEKLGGNVNYYDKHTGDLDLKKDWTDVYLIGYWDDYTEKLLLPDDAILIDPWRKAEHKHHSGEIIHYGDTRPKKKFKYPLDSFELLKNQIYQIWPELHPYDNKIQLIYAGVHSDYFFNWRPFEDIVEEINQAIALGKTKFIFACEAEDFKETIVSKIHRLARFFQDKIPSNNFFYWSGADNISQLYETYCQSKNYNERINLLSSRFFEYSFKKQHEDLRYMGEYELRGRGKKFLCFNKVPRDHRIMLVERMISDDLLKDSYYSFEGYSDIPDWIDNTKPNFLTLRKNGHLFPLKLNITPERSNPITVRPEDFHYFNDTYFSIITETVYFKNHEKENSIFFSEKIWKSIVMQHPFILAGRAGSLKKLREYGYKTFSPFIDEKYDEITDDQERFEAIMKEVHRLCTLDPYELQSWQKYIKDIVEFNKLHFYTNTDFRNTKNIDALFSDNPVFNNIELPKLEQAKESNVEVIQSESLAQRYEYERQHSMFSTLELDSKIIVRYPPFLDGGGMAFKNELMRVVKANMGPKIKYENALEWCAGFGVLGFEALGLGITDRIVFTDYFDKAIVNCFMVAEENKIKEKMAGYVTPSINGIPITEKFDLVIGNPPHCSNFDEFVETCKNDPSMHPETYVNAARLCVDKDWKIHNDFFSNIGKYLNRGADIYLIENNDHAILKHVGAINGIIHVETYHLESDLMQHGTIMRFKYSPPKR
jgi:UDPglucose 6-dehydrogenase